MSLYSHWNIIDLKTVEIKKGVVTFDKTEENHEEFDEYYGLKQKNGIVF